MQSSSGCRPDFGCKAQEEGTVITALARLFLCQERFLNMQLNLTTDYALRCMLYLADKKGLSTSLEIGRAVGLERMFVQKILRSLREAKLVCSENGGYGGYKLAKEPEDIVLMEILIPFEKTIKINRCLEKDGYCGRRGVGNCSLHEFYKKVQGLLDEFFLNTTLRDVLEQKFLFYPEQTH